MYRILPRHILTQVMFSPMKTNRILLLIGDEMAALREQGKLSDITFGLIDNKIDEIAHVIGGCERIANTPVPFAYTLILQRTVYLFVPFFLLRWLATCIT